MLKKPLNLLALETSSSVLSIALKKGGGKTRELVLEGFFEHAENLLPMTVKLLKKEKLPFRKIDVFLVGRGPGSFTGLRIGLATLKGLLHPKPKPCYGGLSLDLIAEGVPSKKNAWLCVGLDARRERIYSRFYRGGAQGWVPKGKIQALTFSELTAIMPQEVILTGDVLKRYAEPLESLLRIKKIRCLSDSFWYPRASALIRWFEWNQNRKKPRKPLKKMTAPRDFVPLYFRKAGPEEKKKEKRKSHAAAR